MLKAKAKQSKSFHLLSLMYRCRQNSDCLSIDSLLPLYTCFFRGNLMLSVHFSSVVGVLADQM